MKLPLFPTTIAGSLPKPSWLAEPEKLWAPWKLEGAALKEGKRDAVRLAVAMQEKAGIDIVSDGEQTRRHFVNGYMEKLQGIDFKNLKTVRIRNRYDANVPRVVDKVARPFPVHEEDARFLRATARGAIKFTLPGPMTMVDTLYDEHYGSREKLAMAFAEILNQEARELAAAGVDVVQFDEPAFNVYFDEVRDWGVAALEKARAGLACTTAVHICYGYGIEANIKWKETLGAEWRQYEQTFPLLAKSSIDQVSLECANSHVPLELMGLLQGKDVLVGCIDVASTRVETPEDVANVIQFDEPAFNVDGFMGDIKDWGIETLERAAEGLKCKTAVHICYGYGIEANIKWKETLGAEWRQYEQTFPLLAKSSIDQVSLECANSHVPMDLMALLKGKDVLVGCIDVASTRVETPEDVANVIRAALKYVPKERLYPCTNCGMVPLPRDVARAKLNALGAGAALMRTEAVQGG